MKLVQPILLYLMCLFLPFVGNTQNISISGSCFITNITLIQGGDATLPTLNGKPVYYNATVQVNYNSTILNAEAYLYYELAANLSTPEDRWVISLDGQPFYYAISNSATAPTGNYLPFDPGAPASDCGGTVAATNSFPLSIELLQFDAQVEGDANTLRWITAQENNNAYFSIERSANGIDFYNLATVFSLAEQGHSVKELHYNFTDNNPLIGQNYYRLMQTDVNKESRIASKVIQVHRNANDAFIVYPNPVTEDLFIQFHNSSFQNHSLILRDLTGRIIRNFSIATLTEKISLQYLPKGSYIIQCYGDDQLLESHILLKQ